ncbi:hypothetical protein PK34_00095 [Stutzerimonas stutzeri]|nr:hypothetical protein PK34_00095 [Stutzerimonas stutzeri]
MELARTLPRPYQQDALTPAPEPRAQLVVAVPFRFADSRLRRLMQRHSLASRSVPSVSKRQRMRR